MIKSLKKFTIVSLLLSLFLFVAAKAEIQKEIPTEKVNSLDTKKLDNAKTLTKWVTIQVFEKRAKMK